MKNRLIIFVFYDKYGFADNSVLFFLKELKKHTTEILFVANGRICEKSKKEVSKYAQKILERENKGYDAWALKEGMEYLGEEYLSQFDEILHVNDSCYGPIFPFSEMFDEMDKKDVDFWGITKHKGNVLKVSCCKIFSENIIPEHIQTIFTCYRKNLFTNKVFKDFWNNLPEIKTYDEAICYYELELTRTFAKEGFKYDTYMQTDDWYDYTACPIFFLPQKLLENRCPIIKKKLFYDDYQRQIIIDIGRQTKEAFEYIKNKTNFDTNIIWDNLLRVRDMANIQKNLQLNYILSDKTIEKPTKKMPKFAVILHLTYEDLLDESIKYLKNLPPEADVYITTKPARMKKLIEEKIKDFNLNKVEIRVVKNRGRSESAFLIECKDVILNNEYKYICFTHDKKSSSVKPFLKIQSWSYKLFENTLKSSEFIKNIISTFEDNPRLGLLTPPTPFHSGFLAILGNEWTYCRKEVQKLAKRLDLKIEINDNTPFIGALGAVFWFRAEALRKLFEYNWQYEDFPEEPLPNDGTIMHAIERIYSFVAQDAGYYTGWLMNNDFASIETTNSFFYLETIKAELEKKLGVLPYPKLLEAIKNLPEKE